MSHFCLLSSADQYVADDWDLLTDEVSRRYWLELFAKHFAETLRQAGQRGGRAINKQIAAAREEFATAIEQLAAGDPGVSPKKLNVMELCRLREGVLRRHELDDPFGRIKERENALATKLYPQIVRKLHDVDGVARWLHLIKRIFAGNTFDLGSFSTLHLAAEPMDFLAAVENTKPRPWLLDDYDRLAEDLPAEPPGKWSKAVVFLDNAGSDFILGVMPLVRQMAMFGTKIVLAANERPSLNDITADETVGVFEGLMACDDDLAALARADMFEVVSTGNDIPLIDLSEVSDELNAAAADAELVILEGMGRAVESNLDATFKTDVLHLATLKDPAVAARIGGELFDCVCKYTPT